MVSFVHLIQEQQPDQLMFFIVRCIEYMLLQFGHGIFVSLGNFHFSVKMKDLSTFGVVHILHNQPRRALNS